MGPPAATAPSGSGEAFWPPTSSTIASSGVVEEAGVEEDGEDDDAKDTEVGEGES